MRKLARALSPVVGIHELGKVYLKVTSMILRGYNWPKLHFQCPDASYFYYRVGLVTYVYRQCIVDWR